MALPPPPERRYTFMVVPEGGRGQVRQISFTVAQLRRYGMILAGVSALALISLLFFVNAVPRSMAYRVLFDENVSLKAELQDIERRLDEVDDALRRLRLYNAQLGSLPDEGLDVDALMRAARPSSADAPPMDGSAVEEEGDADPGEALEPAPDAVGEVPAPEASPAAPARPRKRSLGLEGSLVPQGGGDDPLDELELEGPPPDLSPALQWAFAVSDRVRRTAIVVAQLLPRAGLLAESAESRLMTRADFPSMWPVDGALTSRFGYRRYPMNRARWQFHSGIDIGSPYGTFVRAPADGVVVRTAYDRGKGLYVEIDHGDGVLSRMNHNSKINVAVGEIVRRGQAIAQVGSTGASTGPHCHFAILINGEYVDPLLYLPPR